MALQDLRKNGMMAHLLDAQGGERLTFSNRLRKRSGRE